MKAALLSLALLGGPSIMTASDRMPTLNVEALCKARSAEHKLMKLPEVRSVADCVHDETNAKEALSSKVWADAEKSIRDRCAREIVELGTRSYLDLLICIQMPQGLKLQAPDTSTSGKKRKAN